VEHNVLRIDKDKVVEDARSVRIFSWNEVFADCIWLSLYGV
jgi:hypothetical protein